MGWRSSVLMAILVFAILFSFLYYSTHFAREKMFISINQRPKITEEQAVEIVQKDLRSRNLPEINEVIAYKDDNFESRTYVPFSEFNGSGREEYLLPLVLPRTSDGNVSITFLKVRDGGAAPTVEMSEICSANDAFVCVTGCIARDRLFWILDIDSEYYAIDAMNGDILFSNSLREQLTKSEPSCFIQSH